jgi:hypothetical protein
MANESQGFGENGSNFTSRGAGTLNSAALPVKNYFLATFRLHIAAKYCASRKYPFRLQHNRRASQQSPPIEFPHRPVTVELVSSI